MADILLITRQGTEHIIRFAFEVAKKMRGCARGWRAARYLCREKQRAPIVRFFPGDFS